MAHWRTIEPDAVAAGVWAMSRSKYFSTLAFSDAEIDQFFNLVSVDADTMQKLVRERYSIESLKTFDVLPFAKHPLVTFGDYVSCVSVKLLSAKLTTGLHYVFLDEKKFDRTRRGKFLDYMGSVFEDYLSRLFGRVYPPAANRYLGPAELAGAISGKSCDYLIHYGDALVLIEAKATRFTLSARTEASWSDYQRAFNEIFLDSAAQIDNTVRAIEAGKLLHLGVDPAVIRSYYPVIVTLEDLPMNRAIYRKVREDIARSHLLEQPKVKALQATDVGEMEFLEIAMNAGASLRDILQEKVDSEEGRDESLGNYLLLRDSPFTRQGQVNEYLGGLFTKLGDRALEAFRKNKRSDTEDDTAE